MYDHEHFSVQKMKVINVVGTKSCTQEFYTAWCKQLHLIELGTASSKPSTFKINWSDL